MYPESLDLPEGRAGDASLTAEMLSEELLLQGVKVQIRRLEEEIKVLEAQIAPLQAKKEELLKKIASYRGILSAYCLEDEAEEPPFSPGTALPRGKKSVGDHVCEVLKEEFPRGASCQEILEALLTRGVKVGGSRPKANLSTYLARDKRLERIGRGAYRLKQE